MARIKFHKGKQREFLKKVLLNSDSPSLRALRQFGVNVPYSSLKSYFNENRTLPEELLNDLCVIGKLDKKEIEFEVVDEHWGQSLGGKKSRRI